MSDSDHEIRAKAAAYYDLTPPPFDDLPFYRGHIRSPKASILELGCGTGRALVPLAEHCDQIYGIDISIAMLDRCRTKIQNAGIQDKARVAQEDITRISLHQRFDLIIAPNRVMQRLVTDEQVDRMLSCIGFHLRRDGICILNAANPEADRQTLLDAWVNSAAVMLWQKDTQAGKVKHFERRSHIQPDPLVLYPELIYRLNRPDDTYDQITVRVATRCWYSDQFVNLIRNHGFRILDSWGGYSSQKYGEGPELVVAFTG